MHDSKRNGPRIAPWGTPTLTISISEVTQQFRSIQGRIIYTLLTYAYFGDDVVQFWMKIFVLKNLKKKSFDKFQKKHEIFGKHKCLRLVDNNRHSCRRILFFQFPLISHTEQTIPIGWLSKKRQTSRKGIAKTIHTARSKA